MSLTPRRYNKTMKSSIAIWEFEMGIGYQVVSILKSKRVSNTAGFKRI